MENAKIKEDLNRLRVTIADADPQNKQIREIVSKYYFHSYFLLYCKKSTLDT